MLLDVPGGALLYLGALSCSQEDHQHNRHGGKDRAKRGRASQFVRHWITKRCVCACVIACV